jgi:hypothetical protein
MLLGFVPHPNGMADMAVLKVGVNIVNPNGFGFPDLPCKKMRAALYFK